MSTSEGTGWLSIAGGSTASQVRAWWVAHLAGPKDERPAWQRLGSHTRSAGRRSAPDRRPPPLPGIARLGPPRQPLTMPVQDLHREGGAPALATEGMALRRSLIFAGAGMAALTVGLILLQVLGRDGWSVLEVVTFAISVVLSGWVGFGAASAAAGFIAALGDPRAAASSVIAPPVGRTAILLPTYNEDPGLVLAAVEAMGEELNRLGVAAAYDFFVLSDTRDEAIARAETTGVLRTRVRLGPTPPVYYRRRAENRDRKAGNIADWVETQGGGYDYMLVLDADSLMTGESVVALSSAMDQDPKLGLLQTAPALVNAETPFARLQQFASSLYGPIYARGLQWWSGTEGNYWGHNAIIRVRAFAGSAGLPHLSGPRPFGGHIQSHDFVEAALLRRNGWAVRTRAELPGSYEETPPTLLDTIARDRRWCQGNLQHVRLLAARGLHWVSRLHLFCGVFAYVAPALWLALLVCGGMVWPAQRLTPGTTLHHEVIALFALELALLAAPKALALILAVAKGRARGFGGTGALALGCLAETIMSLLTAPVMMLMQTVAVVEVLVGGDSGWSVQRREGVEVNRRDAWRAHGAHVLIGLAGAAGAFMMSRDFLIWASPVFLSLTLSAALSFHTSQPGAGRALRRRGLMQIPEERAPPRVLVRARSLRQAYAEEAGDRRRIDEMFRSVVPPYDFRAPRPAMVAKAA